MYILKKFTFNLYLPCLIFIPVDAQNDCYFRETKQVNIIGNSCIEIRIDPISGVITRLLNKSSDFDYLGNKYYEASDLLIQPGNFIALPPMIHGVRRTAGFCIPMMIWLRWPSRFINHRIALLLCLPDGCTTGMIPIILSITQSLTWVERPLRKMSLTAYINMKFP